MKEDKEIKVTSEEQQLIFKGIRPVGMDFTVFRKVRKDLNKSLKMYLGGQFKHVSVNLNTKLTEIKSKGTYIRTEPKQLGRGRKTRHNVSK